MSLAFECWFTRNVVTLVGGFERFIKANDLTTYMTDLSGYRCLVTVNHLSDIPENLMITFSDFSMSVLIQLER